jgi:hypothetical protein
MLLLDGVGKSRLKRVKETRDCRPVIGVIVLIIQWHETFGMFSNSIKCETCIILKNADHVLWILGVRDVRNGVQASILELLQEGSLEDRQITAAVKRSLQSLLMIVVAFLSST